MPTCLNHPAQEAIGGCSSCGQPFCASCLVEFMGYWHCGRCRDYRMAQIQGHYQPENPTPTFSDHLVPARNPNSLIGYYLGVFGLIPCAGNFLGPAAIIFGVLALRARKKNPNLPGRVHALTAIILGSMEVVGYWLIPIAMILYARFRGV